MDQILIMNPGRTIGLRRHLASRRFRFSWLPERRSIDSARDAASAVSNFVGGPHLALTHGELPWEGTEGALEILPEPNTLEEDNIAK